MKLAKRPIGRNTIRALITGAVAGIIAEGMKLWVGESIADWLKTFSKSTFYANWVVPFAVGILPLLATVIAVACVLSVEDNENGEGRTGPDAAAIAQTPTGHVGNVSESSLGFVDDFREFGEKGKLLHELGIVGVTHDLKGSEFHPHKCMSRTHKHLMFMGILGSKWISDPAFEGFVRRIHLVNGSLRFLLIHPEGRSFTTLTELRQGNISTTSLLNFAAIRKQYPILRVKLYEDLPEFRLVFFDGQNLAVSRYKLDHEGYFESKQGWDAPHLVISSAPTWSLYDTFEEYFNNIWNRSTDIDDYFSSKSAVPEVVASSRAKKGGRS